MRSPRFPLIEVIEFITFVAITVYVVFGGADYGAGILELFKSKSSAEQHEAIVTRAIGPVWEANHIWLILVVVIFFNGFPTLYTTISTYLHLPILALLVGIVTRGASFTMRHYDIFSNKPTLLYSRSFSWSSLWTSVCLGVITGACVLGRINPAAEGFVALYVDPWLNYFSFSMGIFTASVFCFLAATFLIGEAEDIPMKKYFMRRAVWANLAVVLSGGIVFIAAEMNGLPLLSMFFKEKIAIAMWISATMLWLIQWGGRNQTSMLLSRITAAGQVVCVLLGFFTVIHPTVIATASGPLTFANTAATPATLFQLLIALVVGLVIILPCLSVLFWIFKFKTDPSK